jgi:hypothetical protein
MLDNLPKQGLAWMQPGFSKKSFRNAPLISDTAAKETGS